MSLIAVAPADFAEFIHAVVQSHSHATSFMVAHTESSGSVQANAFYKRWGSLPPGVCYLPGQDSSFQDKTGVSLPFLNAIAIQRNS